MKKLVLYVHGKGGSAAESEHYQSLFPEREVTGLDYQTFSPWETGAEIRAAVEDLKDRFAHILLIANSIGAYFSMNAGIDSMIQKAYFISPIVDMEKLITDMMHWAGITEEELKSKGMIHTAFGEDLSWDYLCYVRNHPVDWTAPTQILYGSRDNLTSYAAISGFAEKHNAGLTVMDSGEHWFHTEDQMRFLDEWILREEHKSPFPLKNDNENAGNMCYSIDNDKQINDQEAAVMEKNKDANGYRQDGPGQRGDLL